MINLATRHLREGMVTAQSIYNSQGASFLTKGSALNIQYINRLKKLNINELTVTSLNPSLPLPPPDDVVQEKTRVTAIHNIFNTFQSIQQSGQLDMKLVQTTAEELLHDIISQRMNLIQITDIRLHDTYTFSHSVNVSILATMLGILCNYPQEKLITLTLSALLHDIGKVVIPSKILNKPSALTDEEFDIMRRHPEAGRKKLRELNSSIASILALVAGQHHEHMDGGGYPDHLLAKGIHPFSRIVAIADVYDALSSNRPYKKAYKPNVVYKIMSTYSSGQFDLKLLQLFFDNIAIYPVGTVMKTELGYAIVKKVIFGQTRTPIICVFARPNATLLRQPVNVDLSQCPPDTIDYILEDTDLLNFIHTIGIDPATYLQ